MFGTPELLEANFVQLMQSTAFDIEYSTSSSISNSELRAFIDSAMNLQLHLLGGNESYRNLLAGKNGIELRALQYLRETAHTLIVNARHPVLQLI
jgi:predicted RNA-binding protein Jag